MKASLFIAFIFCIFSCGLNDLNDPAQPGLLVPKTVDEDPSLPSLAVNGTLLHVETFGEPADPLIIVIHGGPGGDYRSLLNLKTFADEGYRVVFYDQRGSGLSQRVDEDVWKQGRIQLYINDLGALIDHFQLADTQKVFLVGHSWGAMLATAFVNQNPDRIAGAVLGEPGGFTWEQTKEYLSRSLDIQLFSEAVNDAVFPDQIFAGRSEHEILDYKASYFQTAENAPGNVIGNAGQYPFWRNGAVASQAGFAVAEEDGFDFTTNLSQFQTKVLFAYSELSRAYGLDWAEQVSAPYPNVELVEIKNSGHELVYFGWEQFSAVSLAYLNSLK